MVKLEKCINEHCGFFDEDRPAIGRTYCACGDAFVIFDFPDEADRLRALNADLLAALREIHGASRETYVRQTAMDAIEKAERQGTIEP